MTDPRADGDEEKPTRPGRLWRFCYWLGDAAEGGGVLGALLGTAAGLGGLYLFWRLGYPIAVLLLLFAGASAGLAFFFLCGRSG